MVRILACRAEHDTTFFVQSQNERVEENYLDILKEAFRMFHGDEAGFQIKPNPKSVKLIVPTEIDDVFMAKRKNGFSNRSCEFFCVRRSAPPILCIPI